MNRILLIITGSIAAPKCIDILEKLNQENYLISCILTEDAKKYIKINRLKKYTKNKIYTDSSEKKNKMLHINLSRKNDLILVCPATANSIAKFAYGLGNNLASNTLLASNKKIIFAPAMNGQMWANKSNQKNIETLKDRGHEFIGPEIGNLKCGEYGVGRISDAKKIFKKITSHFQGYSYFHNKKCVITAGPTVEMIDPIRYISNQSSGKQGYEIAFQLALTGSKVILISGPTNLDPPPNVKLIKVKSAKDMYDKVKNISNVDIGIHTAAVSDFRIKNIKKSKIKKNKTINLKLIKNIDILKKIGKDKIKRPKVLVGFAAETGNLLNAENKLKNKNCDIIVYNKISKDNPIFGSDYNKITIITKKSKKNYKKMSKVNCAKEILKHIYTYEMLK